MSWKSLVVLILLAACQSDGFTTQRIIHPGQDEFFELSIIHLNDFHARFVQTNSESNTCRPGQECIGGLARVLTVSRELLKERPNPIFLNAGDNYQGTLWYNIHKWNATAHFINKLPQDVVTLGNHEFDDDVAGLVLFLQRIRVPVVVTNIDASDEPTMQGLFDNSTVLVRGNRTIGVIGVLITTTTALSHTGKLKFLDEVESVNAEAKRLKSRGVNLIVVLSHVGLALNRKIAANCPEVDVIVGGHSHTFLYSGEPPFIDDPADEYPIVVQQNNTNRTVLIVQAGAFTKYLGNLTVWFDGEGEVADWEGNPIFLDSFIEEDPEMLEELKPWAEAVSAVGERVVVQKQDGQSRLVDVRGDRLHQRRQHKDAHPRRSEPPLRRPGHGSAVRAHLGRRRSQGTRFSNGSRGRDKESFSEVAFLQWSGIRVVYNMSKPAWSRVDSLTVRCQACKEPNYGMLSNDQWYRVVSVSYVTQGGDGVTVIADKHCNLQVGPLDVSAFEDYVESISPFAYELEDRVRLIG